MSYLAGLFGATPKITCDACGLVYRIEGLPPNWFLDGKAPPKWRVERVNGRRTDTCPRCKGICST